MINNRVPTITGEGPDVDRSTITRAIGEMRGLLAERGCAVPDRPGLRLRTLADVFAYATAEGIQLRLDATEVRVRRPPAGRDGRRAFALFSSCSQVHSLRGGDRLLVATGGERLPCFRNQSSCRAKSPDTASCSLRVRAVAA